MKIALDAMGGDHGPSPCIEGALQAAQELNVDVILVGDEKVLSDACQRLGCTDNRLSIKHAPQVVEMHESPATVARSWSKAAMLRRSLAPETPAPAWWPRSLSSA